LFALANSCDGKKLFPLAGANRKALKKRVCSVFSLLRHNFITAEIKNQAYLYNFSKKIRRFGGF